MRLLSLLLIASSWLGCCLERHELLRKTLGVAPAGLQPPPSSDVNYWLNRLRNTLGVAPAGLQPPSSDVNYWLNKTQEGVHRLLQQQQRQALREQSLLQVHVPMPQLQFGVPANSATSDFSAAGSQMRTARMPHRPQSTPQRPMMSQLHPGTPAALESGGPFTPKQDELKRERLRAELFLTREALARPIPAARRVEPSAQKVALLQASTSRGRYAVERKAGTEKEKETYSKTGVLLLAFIFTLATSLFIIDRMLRNSHPVVLKENIEDHFKFADSNEKGYDIDHPQDVAPNGNIFRLLARETEIARNKHDLFAQMIKLANNQMVDFDVDIASLLDAVHWNDHPDLHKEFLEIEDEPRSQRWSRTMKLSLYLLSAMDAAMDKDKANAVEDSSDPTRLIAIEFLKQVIVSGGMWKFGPFLVPRKMYERHRWIKERLLTILVSSAMLLAPALILSEHWFSKENHLRYMQKSDLSWQELSCLEADNTSTQILGCIFLIFIFEYSRRVCKAEIAAYRLMKHLPADTLWVRLGQFTNCFCIIITMLALPLVFWSEEDAQGIVFDSLAILFIFAMDDLGSETASFIRDPDEDFNEQYTLLIYALHKIPVDLSTLISSEAFQLKASEFSKMDYSTQASKLWHIELSESGYFKVDHGDFEVRLRHDDARNEGLIYHPMKDEDGFRLLRFGASLVRFLWVSLSWALFVLEFIVPFLYVFASKPCYRPDE